MKTLIIGANGQIGRLFCCKAHQSGFPLRAMVREPGQAARFREQGIETVVEFRFGDSARPILEGIRKLTSIDTLRTVLQRAKTAERAEELRAWLSDQDECQ